MLTFNKPLRPCLVSHILSTSINTYDIAYDMTISCFRLISTAYENNL
jgi:hypothetical protein